MRTDAPLTFGNYEIIEDEFHRAQRVMYRRNGWRAGWPFGKPSGVLDRDQWGNISPAVKVATQDALNGRGRNINTTSGEEGGR